MEAKNPHLAFTAHNAADPEASQTVPQMFGLPDESREPLGKIIITALNETDTHAEALAYISRNANTPEELMFLGWCYLNQAVRDNEQIDRREKLASVLAKILTR